MLMVEVLVTRLFSVLFFYHYSFFAVSLVMSGLSLGGIVASRMPEAGAAALQRRLASAALIASGGILAALGTVIALAPPDRSARPSLASVLAMALAFAPALTAAGTFLAIALRQGERFIGRLYAADLLAAGLACLAAIPLMRTLQGPAALVVPALLAAAAVLPLSPRTPRTTALAVLLMAASALGAGAHLATGGAFLALPLEPEPTLERWNEHSRIVAYERSEDPHSGIAVIDKSAGTFLPRARPRRSGDPLPIEPWWGEGITSLAYRAGRPMPRVAIIGVGGGRDVLAALACGAEHVDGYELNRILVDMLRADRAGIAAWPEVTLVHAEARVAIGHAPTRYDVIQASLIDTWAATASGGFVLSENGLYTVEAWCTFLRALSPTGVLTMTRWYLPEAPAEVERLVSLAASALAAEGAADASSRLFLAAETVPDSGRGIHQTRCTLAVSRAPFAEREVRALRAACDTAGWRVIVAPGAEPADRAIARLLAPASRAGAIAESPFDLTPPTDLRPYFFLQLRPWDVLAPARGGPAFVVDITFRAVKVLAILCLTSIAFAVAVAVLGARGPRAPRVMTVYFAAIGLGYILVQLGLHQRLTLVLGHPTLALSVVLASMLWATGLGSAASQRVAIGRAARAWIAIGAVVAGITIALPFAVGLIERIAAPIPRAAACGLIAGAAGFVLGFAFPLGARLVPSASIPSMWAVNGAASIAGSALASVIGLACGSQAVLGAGLMCYVVVAICGIAAVRSGPVAGA